MDDDEVDILDLELVRELDRSSRIDEPDCDYCRATGREVRRRIRVALNKKYQSKKSKRERITDADNTFDNE